MPLAICSSGIDMDADIQALRLSILGAQVVDNPNAIFKFTALQCAAASHLCRLVKRLVVHKYLIPVRLQLCLNFCNDLTAIDTLTQRFVG